MQAVLASVGVNQGLQTMISIRNLLRNRRGAAAAAFALSLPIILSGMALAIDYASFRVTHTRMQNAADAAALAAIGNLTVDDKGKVNKAVAMVNANLPEDFGDVTRNSDVTLGTYTKAGVFTPATGAAVNAARVVAERSAARDNAVNRIFSMFISDEAMVIRVVAIAARPGNVAYEPPEITVLDSDAHDFNELYAYCFDPATNTRGELKLIANNRRPNVTLSMFPQHPTDPTMNLKEPNTANWPACTGEGQSVSFHLRNFRGANQNRTTLWTTQVFNHFSDTRLTGGVESSVLFRKDDPATTKVDEQKLNLVETILCDTKSKCSTGTKDSIIPVRTGKSPALYESRPCSPGKYMYYGWEDRPPSGSSDRDYNDITMQLRCPSAGALGGGRPRLVG